jgi:hypothetical protein
MTQESIEMPPLVAKFLSEVVLKINPDFRIRNKAKPVGLYSWVRPIAKIFNKGFDTRYITVINGECWFPASYFDKDGTKFIGDDRRTVEILAHEAIHEFDRKRLGTIPFTCMYLFPQILAVFSLLSVLAVWNMWWLLCLLFLLFLAPIPAPGRTWIEVRGYKTNMTFSRMSGWDPYLVSFGIIDTNFVGPNYYYMMPFRDWVARRLLDFSHESEPIYASMIAWYRKNMMVSP